MKTTNFPASNNGRQSLTASPGFQSFHIDNLVKEIESVVLKRLHSKTIIDKLASEVSKRVSEPLLENIKIT